MRSLAVLVAAAVLEVAGDAIIRAGLRGGGLLLVAGGFAVLGSYGIVVNTVRIDFAQLLGIYVGVFAAVSVLVGWAMFGDHVPRTTWWGLCLIVAGSAVIHLGVARR
jgi:small multidrug resistance family-3 protein